MAIIFHDSTLAFEFRRILGASAYGGADINECLATAARIADDNVKSWYQAWNATAERIHTIANTCVERRHYVSARGLPACGQLP